MKYQELGFRCGIEIHQQLDTSEKLFCSCPVKSVDRAADSQVERYLRAVEGESGERDVAAEMESARSRNFVYNHYDDCSCLVELDEEPPHGLDGEALEAALTFARMVGAEVPDELQVMRKIVVDGSNTAGFQRTLMVGLDGSLETERGEVGIEDIELEEESAGIHSRGEEKAVYDLDRLGIPLVEVGTDASIEDPSHAAEVAERIGMLLRSTGKARRGLGTIRQDVNVSIEEGARVEIKGFQEVESIETLIEREVQRQLSLAELEGKLGSGEPAVEDATDVFDSCGNEMVETLIEGGGSAYAVKLPALDGELDREICEGRRLVMELVDYAKSRGLEGLIHSDEDLEAYSLSGQFRRVRQKLGAGEEDAVAVLAGPSGKAEAAAHAVAGRAQHLLDSEVPEETRRAENDLTTSYIRPLPGAARMYPETDIPPVRMDPGRVEDIDQNLPETLEEREKQYREEVGEELASQLVSGNLFPVYEKFRERVEPAAAANLLTNVYSGLESEGYSTDRIEREHLEAVVEMLEEDRISEGEMEELLQFLAEEPGEDPSARAEKFLESRADEGEIREAVVEVLEENQEMVEEQGMAAQGPLMGDVMAKVDADGSKVSEILQKEIGDMMD